MKDYRELLIRVRELLFRAGELLLLERNRPGGPRGSVDKADVDEEIELLLVEGLSRLLPGASIVREEGEDILRGGSEGEVWIVDPHDGTEDFLRGLDGTSISVALVAGGEFRLAAVYSPFATALFGGSSFLADWAQGGELSLNGEPISPPPGRRTLEGAKILISAKVRAERLERQRRALSPAALEHCPSIAVRLALVAVGRADAAYTLHSLSPWDFAGAQALLQAAGGDLWDYSGRPIRWEKSSPLDHDQRGYFGSRSEEFVRIVIDRIKNIRKR